jgi:hypothetical protein
LDKAVHPFFRSASRCSFAPGTGYQINLGFRVVLAQALKAGANGVKAPRRLSASAFR